MWRQVQYFTDMFWCRWSKEYLTSLQPWLKWPKPQHNLSVGHVVLLTDTLTPRKLWLLAGNTTTIPGKNYLVWSVQILYFAVQFINFDYLNPYIINYGGMSNIMIYVVIHVTLEIFSFILIHLINELLR